MTVEFDCEGCGAHVFAFSIEAVPRHGFCDVCAWACEFLDPFEPDEWGLLAHLLGPSDRKGCAP